jgi:hypothetical protein
LNKLKKIVVTNTSKQNIYLQEFPDESTNANKIWWSIDANAGWTSEIALQYLTRLKSLPQIKSRIYMIEQPFPLEFEKVSFRVFSICWMFILFCSFVSGRRNKQQKNKEKNGRE